MTFSEGPVQETDGEFELRLDQWLRDVAAQMPDVPQEQLDYTRDAARQTRVYRSCIWEAE